MHLLQAAGLGPLQPNCLLMAWPAKTEWDETQYSTNRHRTRAHRTRFRLIQALEGAKAFDKLLLTTKLGKLAHWPVHEKMRGYIDVWWVVGEGGLILLLPFLLRQNVVWSRCRAARLFAVALDDYVTHLEIEASMTTRFLPSLLKMKVYN